jgi:hypothetical protein
MTLSEGGIFRNGRGSARNHWAPSDRVTTRRPAALHPKRPCSDKWSLVLYGSTLSWRLLLRTSVLLLLLACCLWESQGELFSRGVHYGILQRDLQEQSVSGIPRPTSAGVTLVQYSNYNALIRLPHPSHSCETRRGHFIQR